MPIRYLSARPNRYIVPIGIVSLLLALLIPLVLQLPAHSQFFPERHAFLQYFVLYLSCLLFLICIRRYYLQLTPNFLFFALGFLTFAVFQFFQVAAVPGFHNFSWFPASENLALGFDLSGRLFLALFLLVGIVLGAKTKSEWIRAKLWLIYLITAVVVIGALGAFIIFSPPAFFIDHESTLLRRGLEILTAVLFLVSTVWLVWRRNEFEMSFWFALAALFAVFSSIYLGLWTTLNDVAFDVGHFLKVFAFTGFLVGFFVEHIRLLSFEDELRQSLEESREEIEKREKTYRELVEKMADGLLVIDRRGTVVFCNEAFCNMLQHGKNEVLGMHLSNFFDPQLYENLAVELEKWTNAEGGQYDIEVLTNGGEKLPVLINAVPISDGKGENSGIQFVVTDLTERKKIEKELENLVKEKTKDIEVFRQCIDNSTDGILITDLDGNIEYTNRAFETMTGYSKPDLINEKTSLFVHNRRSETTHNTIWKTVREQNIWRGEFETRKRSGTGFIGEVSVVPIEGEDDRVERYLWIEKDITRRKALETSLKNYAEELTNKTTELESAKSYYQTLISGMSDILLVVDNDGNCTFINDYGIKRLDFTAVELTKRHLPIFFDDLKRLEKDYGNAIRVEVKDFESAIKTKDGESILCNWYAKPLFDGRNRRIGAMAVGRDITEYKNLQHELQDYTKNLEEKVKARTSQLQQKVSQLGKILEVGEEIRLNVDIDVILNKICEAVQALGWNNVIISLRDYEKRTSRPVATAGLGPKQVEEVMNWGDIPFEHTRKYLQEKYRISNSYFVDHAANIIDKRAPYTVYTELGSRRQDEWHSMDALLVPIRTKDKILGIISVDDPEDRKKPTLEQIRDLEIFADKAALAIENARLFQAQKENEKRAKLLADISKIFQSSLNMDEVLAAIVNKGANTIGDFCSLILVDDDGEFLSPQSSFHDNPKVLELFEKGNRNFPAHIGDGIIGKVVASGSPLMSSRPFPGEFNGFKDTPFHYLVEHCAISSLIMVPLRIRGKIIGIMIHLSIDSPRQYKKDDFELAQELADRASLALENARLFQETRDKAKELEKANRLKSEFLANVSHELRTPLNAIITLSDILIRGMPGKLNPEQVKQLEIIQRSGKNLLNLINDILDLSKIEAGKIEPIYSVIPIQAVIEETMEHIRPLCVDKGLALEYICTPDVPKEIYSDQDKITKAVVNLVSNAVKFTEKGKIAVRMNLHGPSELRISVTDTGIGIPEDRIEEIFNEFHQIDSSDSRNYGGTGLGLSITKRVMEILGGSVSVVSSPGKGSTFTLSIPLKVKSEYADKKVLDLDEKVSKRFEPKSDLELTDDRDHLDESRKVILTIDDEKEVIYIMRQYLHQSNYQIIFPRNGEDVLELARKYKPFAITLDILMPGRSGWDILQTLKGDKTTSGIPVIVASILAEKERAADMGATGYLVKPFEPQHLLQFLEELASKSGRKKMRLDLPKIWQFKGKESKRPKVSGSKAGAAHRERILLVDDDQDTQYAMQYMLEEAGYQVFVAGDGREAIKQAESVKPHLILMDIMMPGMDGYKATQILKKKERFKKVPIVAMTAKAMKGDREKTILAGCDDYIAKPFETGAILNIINKWMQQDKMN